MLQDEGVRVNDVKAGNDLPHNTAEGFQDDNSFAFDFQIDQLFSSPRKPGPSLVSRAHQVFDMGPDSESDGEEDREEEPDHGEDTYVWFKAYFII